MLVYLAAPIDFTQEGGPTNALRQEASDALSTCGFAVYNPAGAFLHAGIDPQSCYAMNELAIRSSHAMLAILPPGVPSVGTPMEVLTAVNLGKPVVVVGPTHSMQLLGMGVPVFGIDDITRAVDKLESLCGGVEPSESIDRSGAALLFTGDVSCRPVTARIGDAGLDMIVSDQVAIPPNSFVDVPLGINIELPEGMWAMLTGRSSTIRKRGLLVTQGIIDNGYRGPMFAGVWNLTDEHVVLLKGERIAQLIILPLAQLDAVEHVAELSETSRGLNGFGSTGV